MQRFLPLIGRALLALIFVMSGLSKITDFGGTQEYMAAYGMPATALLLVGAIIIEVLGGLAVLTGYRARLGAAALIAFLIPATLIFHTEFSDQQQIIHFLKNLAIIGGLLLVIGYGSGPLSLGTRSDAAARQTTATA